MMWRPRHKVSADDSWKPHVAAATLDHIDGVRLLITLYCANGSRTLLRRLRTRCLHLWQRELGRLRRLRIKNLIKLRLDAFDDGTSHVWWNKATADDQKPFSATAASADDTASVFLEPVTPAELQSLHKRCTWHKATADRTPDMALLSLPDYPTIALAALCTYALRHGSIAAWRNILVVLLPKNNGKIGAKAHRPISLLAAGYRITMLVLLSRMERYATLHEIQHFAPQTGFQKHRGCDQTSRWCAWRWTRTQTRCRCAWTFLEPSTQCRTTPSVPAC